VQLLLGIVFVAGFYWLARALDLRTLTSLLEAFLIFLPFALIVLFQHEIRRALASFGRNPLWGLTAHQDVESSFQEIVLAASSLSARKIGALIVIERLEGLRNYIEGGIPLDATVTYDLLATIFQPGSPLHDGAVIVQADRIAAAACFLPLSVNPKVSRDLGTRHRAALGLTEENDAIGIVVSEETGVISLAIGGDLERGVSPETLRLRLRSLLGIRRERVRRAESRSSLA
jgi:diadenylate cyclase